MELNRRNLFQIAALAPAAAVLGSAETHDHAAQVEPARAPFQRRTFDDAQWRTVHILCDLVIPADARSGSASEAGVPEFMDDWIAFRKQEDGSDILQSLIFGGLVWLDRESVQLCGKHFADAPLDSQRQLLDRIAFPARAAEQDKRWVLFFNSFRDLTAAGFFSSKMGVADLPYLGNTAVAEWKGCDMEIWTLIEDRIKNGYKGMSTA